MVLQNHDSKRSIQSERDQQILILQSTKCSSTWFHTFIIANLLKSFLFLRFSCCINYLKSIKIDFSFPNVYLHAFSLYTSIITTYCNRFNAEIDMRMQLSFIKSTSNFCKNVNRATLLTKLFLFSKIQLLLKNMLFMLLCPRFILF